MSEASQIYVRFNKGDKKGLIANYYGWNYGERMISRAKAGIDYIKAHLEYDWYYGIQDNVNKLSKVFDVNFDMRDVAISCNIIQEYQELYPEVDFADAVFKTQQNDDGKLLIDIDGDVIKYAFLNQEADVEQIMDAEEYMNWNNEGDWREPTEYFPADAIQMCEENIKFISETAQLMTKAEVLEFIHYDYAKDLGIVKDEDFLTIDKLVNIETCGLGGIGECVIDVINEEDNSFRDIGKTLHQILSESRGNEEMRKGIEQAILAITGYELSTIVGRLKETYSKELAKLEAKEMPGLDERIQEASARTSKGSEEVLKRQTDKERK